ncbi:MAG: diguanylate cyclase [Atopobiaceae bacterium]|jgi:diguanylate cyclase (GGDEF)-like protein|nr:GGDEF domain-containing protein [Atopobiaceae bacterium]
MDSPKKPTGGISLGRLAEALVVVGAALLLCVALAIRGTEDYAVASPGQELSSWEEAGADGQVVDRSVPISLDGGGEVSLSTVLPEVRDGQSLMVKVNFSSMDVRVDGETVFSVGATSLGPIRTMVGNYIAFVPLHADYSGRTVQLDVTKRDPLFASAIKHATVIDSSDYLVVQAHAFLANLVIATLYCMLGLLMFALWLVLSLRGINLDSHERGAYAYAGLFLLSVGIWTISDVHLLGVFLHRLTASGLINYLAFGLMPIGCLGMTRHLYAQPGRAPGLLLGLAQLNFVAQCALFLAGMVDLPQMLPATQVICVLAILVFVIETVADMRRHPVAGKRVNVITAVVAAAAFVVAIVLYALDMSTFSWLTLAIVVIVTNIVLQLLSAAYQMMRDGIKLDEMRVHAYTDDLTGLGNRRAYAEEVDRIRRLDDRSRLVLGQIDVNGLKNTNDSLGHAAGDELLRVVSHCISSCFGPFAKCYRMGGDEFSILAFADGDTYGAAERRLRDELARWQGEYVRSPSISMGSAAQADHPGASVTELEREADAEMYQEKRIYYSDSGTDRRKLPR